jgi:hypothetical protein
MARKLELKDIGLANGGEEVFSYGTMLRAMLRHGPPGGITYDEICSRMDALKPIDAAIAAKADHVVLTEEQWQTVKDKLTKFPFGVADQLIVDFGLMIRNAPEIGTQPAPRPPRRPDLTEVKPAS